MRRRAGEDVPISLNNAAVRMDFHSFKGERGGLRDDLEVWLSDDIESPAAAALDRFRRGEQPDADEAPTLARFVASGLLRTATTRTRMAQIDDHLGPTLLMHEYFCVSGVDPTTLSPASFERLRSQAREVWTPRPPADMTRSYLRTLLREFDKLSNRLTEWKWRVLTTEMDSLITSDAPVVTFPPNQVGWHGIIPPGSPVFMPLAPRALLVGEERSLGLATLRASTRRRRR